MKFRLAFTLTKYLEKTFEVPNGLHIDKILRPLKFGMAFTLTKYLEKTFEVPNGLHIDKILREDF